MAADDAVAPADFPAPATPMAELRLLCPEDRVDVLCEALDALDATSVSVEDADADTDAEQALFGEPGMLPAREAWSHSRLCALFPEEQAAQAAANVLTAQDFFVDCRVLEVALVHEQDWVRITQSQFAPVEITPDFWIVPSWHEPPVQARRWIRLDPGLAFGTGTHPTTRMCLRWLSRQPLVGRSVLDYGCGSGILAIGAALHGASSVLAVDIDPAAVQATQANAQANRVSLRSGLPDQATGRWDVVVANILASPLKVLAPLLAAHTAAGGHLVLAGILERQATELQQAYAPFCRLEVADAEDGWVLMTSAL